ncbi:hypothetical protein D6789_03625 [Candidatus Woesearchaeota archaeon]|nr:MAG: hypothetical protein D6789_03625 [Candidatus Woesearchaeota archaeon]
MALLQELEALLFSSGRAMEEDLLCSLTSCEKRKVRAALKKLKEEYESRDTALQIFNEGRAWKMLVRDPYISLVRRIVADTELPRPVLETLAVIAYNRPALQSKVVEVRGAHAYEHIKLLEELGFITKTPEGRSFTLKLSEKFFEYFDVEDGAFDKVFEGVTVPERTAHEAPPENEEATPPPTPPKKLEKTAEERAAEQEFLKRIEGKLTTLAEKNAAREADKSFRLEEQKRAETTGQEDEQVLKERGD